MQNQGFILAVFIVMYGLFMTYFCQNTSSAFSFVTKPYDNIRVSLLLLIFVPLLTWKGASKEDVM